MVLDTPWSLNVSLIQNQVSLLKVSIIATYRKWTLLVKLSIIIQVCSYHWVWGNLTTKSVAMSSHFLHMVHFSITWSILHFIPSHQKFLLGSRYIFVLLGYIKYDKKWASISSLSKELVECMHGPIPHINPYLGKYDKVNPRQVTKMCLVSSICPYHPTRPKGNQ